MPRKALPEPPVTATNAAEPLWTPTKTCDYLCLNHLDGTPNLNRLYLLRSRYGLPAFKLGGQLRFRESDILQWLKQRSIEDDDTAVAS